MGSGAGISISVYRYICGLLVASIFLPLIATAQGSERGKAKAANSSASTPSVHVLDSLYLANDTTALTTAVTANKSDTSAEVSLYRGVAAAWNAQPANAIAILHPLLTAPDTLLSRAHRRTLLRTLAQSYARTKQYDSLTTQYDWELRALDSSLDAAAAKEFARLSEPPPLLQSLASPDALPPTKPERVPKELGFIGLLFALFVIPKILQRVRIPGAITSLCMGAAAASLGWLSEDPTVGLLSTLGIVTLFLFAGLEIDAAELRRNAYPLTLHAAIWTALALVTGWLIGKVLHTPPRVSALLALAIVTPSTGFILSTLRSFGLNKTEQATVRTYAIGSELIALSALFFVLQSTSAKHLLLAVAAMMSIVIFIPIAFRVFAAVVAPYAPRSEFAFLVMVAVVCAYATKVLGVYYLVGAFLVGVAAQRFRASHPAMSSEKMIDALESFGSVFIPFYFFHAGMGIAAEQMTLKVVGIAVLLLAGFVPLRLVVTSLHRRIAHSESFVTSRRVGSAMIPTLVFTLVIVSILETRFGLKSEIAGALVLYAIVNTTMPGLILRSPPADFEDVEALPHTA